MSRAPIISNTIKHEFNTTKIDLPRSTQDYAEIFSYEGFGDFHGAIFKFNSDSIMFKMEIDGFIFSEIDINDLNSFLGYIGGPHSATSSAAITYNNSDKLLDVAFPYPIQYKESIKMYARANSNNANRDMQGYSIFLTKDNL